MSIVEYVKSGDFKGEKHVPVIEVPKTVTADTYFNVEVTVGKEIPHPNLTEHFIENIALYYKPDNGKFVFQLGKAQFTSHGESAEGPNKGPVYTDPHAIFKIKVAQSGTLTAVSYCNIHGLWESSVKVEVK